VYRKGEAVQAHASIMAQYKNQGYEASFLRQNNASNGKAVNPHTALVNEGRS
jgi:hypothetical protein